MKKVAIIAIFAACMISCNSNRYAYVDVASSERTAEELENGFRNVPDSIKDGRTIFLMSQGIPVADILFYKGRLNNPTLPAVPYGYDYEYITEDQLINDLEVGYGRLYTKSGINARVLVILDKDVTVSEMTKIARLAQNGALIGGVRPTRCLDSADMWKRSGRMGTSCRERPWNLSSGLQECLKTKRRVQTLLFFLTDTFRMQKSIEYATRLRGMSGSE